MIERTRSLSFDEEARAALLAGVNALAHAVVMTMGPGGRCVIIENEDGPPVVTKDGVSVARAISFSNREMNLGAELIKEAASRTCDDAGDGTTTSTLLAQTIFSSGLRALGAGLSAREFKEGAAWAVANVVSEISAGARQISSDAEIVAIGTISANGETEIGELIARAMAAVGRDGTITVEDAKGFTTSLNVVEGSELDRGYTSPYFITDSERMISQLHNPLVLLTGGKISTTKQMLPLLEKVHSENRALLIIADDVTDEALQSLVLNKSKGVLNVNAIRAPEFGETRIAALQDLAILLKTRVVNEDEIATLKTSELGVCRSSTSSRTKTTLVGAGGLKSLINERVETIREQLNDVTITPNERDALKRRLHRLANGVAIISVGAPTEAELKERRDRVDDALHATRAAVAEGVVAGGGVALLKAGSRLLSKVPSNSSPAFRSGVNTIKEACYAPLRQIVRNAGGEPETVLSRMLKPNAKGFNATSMKLCDPHEAGVIDPARVVRLALINAHSAAITLLSAGCTIVSDAKSTT